MIIYTVTISCQIRRQTYTGKPNKLVAVGGIGVTKQSLEEVNDQRTPATKEPMTTEKPSTNPPPTRTQKLRQLREEALLGGGKDRIAKHHEGGKLTARERLELFLDPGTFIEIDAFVTHQSHNFGMEKKKYLGDGVVTGYGRVHGRLVYVYAQDFTVLGGSLGEKQAKKICKIMDLSLQNGAPCVGFNDSGGARIQEGVNSLAGYGEIFFRNVLASGVVPQITAIMGPCAGGAVYSPAITDFICMTRGTSHMFVTGPEVVKAVTGEESSFEELGGASIHTARSGVANLDAEDEYDAIQTLQKLLSYIPSNNMESPPRAVNQDDKWRMDDDLNGLVPEDARKPYDMREIIRRIVDYGELFEIHGNWAKNVLTGFARLDGLSVGIIANQPSVLAGALDIDASIKAARFIRFCDAFNIPIVTFVDVPGFLPGLSQEHGGIIRNGAKMIYAYCEATVPKLTVVTRKAYGGAYIVMCSKHLRSDYYVAWPTTEIAVMGPDGAVNIVFKKEISSASDPASKRKELEEEYRNKFANPYVAAERGFIDDIIEPKETRPRLIDALHTLLTKREQRPSKKHGNIPL
jgi:acetyl-CoA/propionyl-CoA carboxylase carboxyl transferase subunit